MRDEITHSPSSTKLINAPPVLLTVDEACERLRISHWSINRLFQQRKLDSIRIGRRRFVPVQAIEKFVEQSLLEGAA
ncbi:helix-turn-helix domain-containing protein [Amycolatopsis azurea]|uniref:helix-turn-helix domain-containing protein n=1 Tax=Amycolatopsis azurea TaxID=36819 RepID=UPI003829AA8C